MNRLYSARLLRNFQVDFLKKTISSFFDSVTQFNKAWRESFMDNGWKKIEEIINTHEVFSDNSKLLLLEDILYKELMENVSDHIHLYPISLRNNNIERVKELFLRKQLPFDKKINRRLITGEEEFSIINVKIDDTKINFLFRMGITRDPQDNKKVTFMVPCIIDLEKQFIQIKFKQCFKTKSIHSSYQILNSIIDKIQELDIIDVLFFNPANVKSIYFQMFKVESERAEKIIKNKAGILNTDQKKQSAEDFLINTFGITNRQSAYFDTYALKMMSIYYHKHALEMTDANFGDRFMFAFSFYDGYATRSSTRNSDKTHVYTGNLYWTLKDLILKKQSLSSISMFYKFNPNDFNSIAGQNAVGVEVNIKESNSLKNNKSGFLIEFLITNHKRRDEKRGIKSEYIISEIKKYLPITSDL